MEIGIAETREIDLEEIDLEEILNFLFPYELKPEQDEKRVKISLSALYYSIRCFYKLRTPKHSLKDLPRIYREHYKPQGFFLNKLFILCINTHGDQLKFKICEYSDATQWFLLILKDLMNSRVSECQNVFYLPKVIHNGERKKYLLGIYSNELTRINRHDNPYKENPDLKHLSYLFDCVFVRCDKNNDFKRDFLKPFIQAGRNIIQDYHSSRWERQYVDDDGNLCINRVGSKSKRYI